MFFNHLRIDFSTVNRVFFDFLYFSPHSDIFKRAQTQMYKTFEKVKIVTYHFNPILHVVFHDQCLDIDQHKNKIINTADKFKRN